MTQKLEQEAKISEHCVVGVPDKKFFCNLNMESWNCDFYFQQFSQNLGITSFIHNVRPQGYLCDVIFNIIYQHQPNGGDANLKPVRIFFFMI